MKTLKTWAFAVIALLASSTFATRAASSLDPTFNPGTGANGIVEQVLPTADGRILICGNFTTFNGVNHPYIARLNSNGSLDETFYGQASYWVRHMSVQTDGKIVIGGYFGGVQGVSRSLIARLNSDGSLDPTFDPGTGATDSLGTAVDGNPDPFVFWTEILPDGKILATGNFHNYNGASSSGIVRINPDGSRDTTFNVGSGLDSWGRSMRLMPNGQFLLTGWFTSYNGRSFNRLVRVNADGSADTTFNPYFGDRTSIYSVGLAANNRVIASGHSLNYDGLFSREVTRLNPDGTEDSTFVGRTNEKTESIAIQPDGKIIIGGYFTAVNGIARTSIARLNPDGSLDDSLQASIDNYVWTAALQSDGKLLISGGFYTVDGVSRNGVARLLTGSAGGPPPPAAPVLSASVDSSTQVTLSWTDSATNRNDYTVERKTGTAGTYATVANLGGSARTYASSGLSAATAYYFRLRATTTSGETVYSNEASATTNPGAGGTATATFIGRDSTTRGAWKGVYGAEGANIFGDSGSYPSYVTVTPSGKTDWIWQYATTDGAALQKISSATDRIAACWYASAGFSVNLRINDGAKHRVSLYLLDWDVSGRVETAQLVDGDTGAVLNTQAVSSFAGGVYLTWEIGGNVKVTIMPSSGNAVVSGIFFGPAGSTPPPPPPPQTVATPTISPNGGTFTNAQTVSLTTATTGAEIRYTVNGVDPTASSTLYSAPFSVTATATVKAKAFKSGMTASAIESATFTINPPSGGGGGASGNNWFFAGIDAQTSGAWMGVYGAEGYHVFGAGASYPAYAQVSAAGKEDWTWNVTSTDPRGLQVTGGNSRIGACWYGSSFTINVSLKDGKTHRLAMYLCDWDFAGRVEKIELLDGATGGVLQTQAISSFAGGQYLRWDLKGNFQIRITQNAGPNAVVNGLFFDAPTRQL